MKDSKIYKYDYIQCSKVFNTKIGVDQWSIIHKTCFLTSEYERSSGGGAIVCGIRTLRVLWDRGGAGGEWCGLWWRPGPLKDGWGDGAGPGEGDGVAPPPKGDAEPGYPLDISNIPPLGYTRKEK